MGEWKEFRLGNLGIIITGKTPSKKNPEDWGDLMLFVTPSDYKNYRKFAFSSDRNLSKNGIDRLFKKVLPINSIMVTCIGSDMGKVAINSVPVITNQQINSIIPNAGIVDNDFLYYRLVSMYEVLRVYGSDGTAVPIINKNDFENLETTLPSLQEQKAIAEVLSSLDDKIDLLHSQNKTLEELAQTLFRQWFIEDAKDEWEEVSLEDVTTKITDGSHTSPKTVKIGMPMASVKDMHQWGININTCRQISKENFNDLTKADCRPLKDDILIAKDGSYLKHIFVVEEDMDVVILSSIAILRPNEKYHPLLLSIFLKLDSTIDSLKNIVTGGVIPRIVLKDFRKYKLLLPPNYLQEKALEKINPIIDKCWVNNKQIKTLENMRDTLLPKLMSGEVRVQL